LYTGMAASCCFRSIQCFTVTSPTPNPLPFSTWLGTGFTAIYASETWKSTARIGQQLDVFNQHNLWKILGMTNTEVLSWTGQQRLQDIAAEIRLRMASHIIRMPPGRPANHAMLWTPCGSGRQHVAVHI